MKFLKSRKLERSLRIGHLERELILCGRLEQRMPYLMAMTGQYRMNRQPISDLFSRSFDKLQINLKSIRLLTMEIIHLVKMSHPKTNTPCITLLLLLNAS